MNDPFDKQVRTWTTRAWVGAGMMCLGGASFVLANILGVLGMIENFHTIESKAAPTPDDLAAPIRTS